MILGVGAKEGIGGALCKKVAEDGYHVVAVGRTAGKLNLVAEEIREMGAVISTFVADLSDEEDIIAVFEKIDSIDGVLSFVTFNAGNLFKEDTLKMSLEFFEAA